MIDVLLWCRCSLNFAKRCRSVELGQAKKNAQSPELARLQRLVEKYEMQLVRAMDLLFTTAIVVVT